MGKAAAAAAKTPGAQDLVANQESFRSSLLRASGASDEPLQLRRPACPAKRPARAGRRCFKAVAAVREGFLGNATEARRNAKAALALSKGKEVEYGAAFAQGLAGDARLRPMQSAIDLEKRFPNDTSVKFYYVPALRALAALNHHNPAKAIESLQINTPYELGVPQSCFFGFFGAMYPVYLRGEAYLALHQGGTSRSGVPEDRRSSRNRHQRSRRRDWRSSNSAGHIESQATRPKRRLVTALS